jgi:hypothetical protein
VTELALNHNDRQAFMGHLNSVGVTELVWRKPAANPSPLRGITQLCTETSRRAWPPPCRSAQDAEQGADGQRCTVREPGFELSPRPAVHPNLTTFAALAATNEDRATITVKVTFGQRECLTDSQAGAP